MKNRISWLLGALFLCNAAMLRAAELSGNLEIRDIRDAASILARGSVHRAWTAHADSNQSLGLDFGIESAFIYRSTLDELGDGNGLSPRITPVPRIWASWDLPQRFNVSGSFSPGMLYDGVSSYGMALQWVYYQASRVSLSAVLNYTYSNAFGDMVSHSPGMTAQVSKDLGVWQPYLGMGFVSVNSTVRSDLLADGVKAGPHTFPASHLLVGTKINLAAQLLFQVDLIGKSPSVAMAFVHRF